MVFIREIVLFSSLSYGLKGGVNSLLKEQQQISFSGLKMHHFFIIRNQPCVPKDEEKWQSHPQDIQTDSKDRNKEETVSWSWPYVQTHYWRNSTLKLGALVLVSDNWSQDHRTFWNRHILGCMSFCVDVRILKSGERAQTASWDDSF